MASARTQTFTLPFDGGTRAEPFAMVADATGNAPAADQQWAQAGARTPIWAHVYNASKTAHEAVSSSNTAQYWEFDQASGATAVKIELLDGASGTAAPSGGLITAADSGREVRALHGGRALERLHDHAGRAEGLRLRGEPGQQRRGRSTQVRGLASRKARPTRCA